MTVYQFEITFIIGIAVLLLWQYPSNINRKIFCILVTAQWVFLSGLRHLRVGADTRMYKVFFESTYDSEWSQAFQSFIDVYFRGVDGKDPGYNLFVKFTQLFIGNHYQIYLVLIAIIFFVPLGIWLYKYSKEPCISALIMSTLFWGFFGVTGIRQTIATSLVVFFGYKFIKERRFKSFLAIVLLASTIHKSAFFYLPFYFIAYKKITPKYIALVICAIPVMLLFRNQIFNILSTLIGYEQYMDSDATNSWVFAPTFIAVFCVAIWRMKPILEKNPDAIIWYNATFIATVFVPLLFVNAAPIRIIQYYSLYILLLIPELINSFDGQERVICYSVAAGTLLTLFFRSSNFYKFFWQ